MTNTMYLKEIERVERYEPKDKRAFWYCSLIMSILNDNGVDSAQKDYLITYAAEKITLLY